jgi:hypothetical protein
MVWLGAGALGCLTAVAMLAADKFWTKSGAERVAQANTCLEHLGLIGGFMPSFTRADSAPRESLPLRQREEANRWVALTGAGVILERIHEGVRKCG